MAIETVKMNLDRARARELWRAYKTHQHYEQPIDAEIRRVYQLIAQGRVVIQALASIAAAGLDEQRRPKLAICRADAKECFCDVWTDGHARFSMERWPNLAAHRRRVEVPIGSFSDVRQHASATAQVPLIPIHLRPKRALANYWILWEAEWRKLPPGDPILLRRIGRADMWLVLAAWDLTEAERAALAGRMNA